MNVLSCFDGMSCGQLALERVGIKVDKYFASEIDKYAIKVTQTNYPNTIQLGSVEFVTKQMINNPIDLLIGGSPCQGFSFAGKQLNFNDDRSRLFFEFVRLLKELKPKYFLLENVRMKKEYQDIISEYLGCKPIEINSSLVSAQNRRRLYWTNIKGIEQPKDKGILLKNILQDNVHEKYILRDSWLKWWNKNSDFQLKKKYSALNPDKAICMTARQYANWNENFVTIENHKSKIGLKCVGGISKNKKWLDNGKNQQRNYSQGERIYSIEGKGPTISAQSGGTAGIGNTLVTDDMENGVIRKLTPIECERLQTLPDNYTNHVSNTQRYKMLGNGWTVDVIAHILKNLKN